MAMDSTSVMEIEVATAVVVQDLKTAKHVDSYTSSYSLTSGATATENRSTAHAMSAANPPGGVVRTAASNAALYPEVARLMRMTLLSGGLVSAAHAAWYPDVKRVMLKKSSVFPPSKLIVAQHTPDVKQVAVKEPTSPSPPPPSPPLPEACEVLSATEAADVKVVPEASLPPPPPPASPPTLPSPAPSSETVSVQPLSDVKPVGLKIVPSSEPVSAPPIPAAKLVVSKAVPSMGGLVSAPHDAWYPDVKRLMRKSSINSVLVSKASAALYPDVARVLGMAGKPPSPEAHKTAEPTKTKSFDVSVNVEITVELSKPAAEKATPPKKKNWSFLPKVPSIRLSRRDSSSSSTVATAASSSSSTHSSQTSDKKSTGSDHAHDHDHDGDEHTDELRSLTDGNPTEKPASVPLASRLRGLSIEQNAFASSIVRKFSTLRSQTHSSTDSPRNSIDAMPTTEKRRSLTDAIHPSSPQADTNAKTRRGACVATKYGTGTVLDIRADDGFYIVQLFPKTIAYLREDMIVREIKAIVGERVKTRWGLATVEQYYIEEDMYSIALDWRWDDDHVWRMKATTKKFEKIPRSMSIVQNTKNKLFEGYSTIRESASFGYANVAAKINTTASTYKAASASARPAALSSAVVPPQTNHHHLRSQGENLGKALTPYGICTVVEVRPDQYFVVETKFGATAFLHADSVKLLHRRTNFAAGERVKTPYGTGEVVRYRDEDEIYEVKLDFAVAVGSVPPVLYISDANAETMLLAASANGPNYARLSSIFTMTRNSVYSASATVKASASGGLHTLSTVKSKVSTMAAIKMTKVKFQKGERVITSFGSGFVSDCRPLERIYEVQLRRLKFRGYFHESALTAFPYERVTHFIVDGKTIPAPEMPKSMPEHKRRNIINTAIRQAREGR